MKTNPIKKLVIAGMGAAMIAAAVGSIGGTVAWFQYNTRASAAYTGGVAKCSENLQIRIYDASLIGANKKYADIDAYKAAFPWGSELTTAKVESYIKAKRGSYVTSAWVDSTDSSLYPVTSGALALNKAPTAFYSNPDKAYAREDYATWDVAGQDKFVQIPLQLRLLDVDGVNDPTNGRNYIEKSLYLQDLTVQADAVANTTNHKKDISAALRVAFKDNATTPVEKTLSLAGTDTTVHGNLDLDHDGELDKVYVDADGNEVKYDFQARAVDPTRTVDYGAGSPGGTPVAKYTKIETGAGKPVADFSDKYAPSGTVFGTLVAGNDKTAEDGWYTVIMTLYLEGWQPLDGYNDTINATLWDDTAYVGSQVQFGITFGVAAIK